MLPQESLIVDRRVLLWPWQVPPLSDGLVPVAVANPALESVLVKGPHGPVAASPHEAYASDQVLGFSLILRVLEAPANVPTGFVAAPRLEAGALAPVIDLIRAEDVDGRDPRIIAPLSNAFFGLRLPSISHLRRATFEANGDLVAVGPPVLAGGTATERYGQEDPSVTWLDGVPWLTYVGVSDWGITPLAARGHITADGIAYAREPVPWGHHDNRDVKLLPVRPGGKLWRYDRPNTLPWGAKRMTWATSPDEGLSWSAPRPLLSGEAPWERHHVGAGAVPFVHGDHLFAYYHGVAPGEKAVAGVYQTGLAWFERERPERYVGRLKESVLSPWSDADFARVREAVMPMDDANFATRHGRFVVSPVVFTTGHTRVDDTQWLFSGVNDFCVERAILVPLDLILATNPAP